LSFSTPTAVILPLSVVEQFMLLRVAQPQDTEGATINQTLRIFLPNQLTNWLS
jgi:hypothetical protein